MPYKRQSRRKRHRRKTAKGNWRWSYYRGLHKKTPTRKAKRNAKRNPKRLRRQTVNNESPLTPPKYYNQYLNPDIYRWRASKSTK